MYQVSDKAGHIIEYDKFYIHELDDLIDIRRDYVTWIQRQMYPMVSQPLRSIPWITLLFLLVLRWTYLFVCLQGHDGVVTLCRYPFVFDAQAKTTLLQTDAFIQMQVITADQGCLCFPFFIWSRFICIILKKARSLSQCIVDSSGPSTDAKHKFHVPTSCGVCESLPYTYRTERKYSRRHNGSPEEVQQCGLQETTEGKERSPWISLLSKKKKKLQSQSS